MNKPPRVTPRQAEQAVRTLIRYLGDDPARPGLLETPRRVIEAWVADWARYSGGTPDDAACFAKLFNEPGLIGPNSEVVVVKDIAIFSHCEHHMTPFFGRAHIGYIPDRGKGVIGISKLARVAEFYARRLQTQERMGNQIADWITTYLSPDAAVRLECTHMCMVSRGVQQPDAKTVTNTLRGAFFDKPEARREFFDACR